MTEWWLTIGCEGACAIEISDDLTCWPQLPQSGPAAVAWVLEHGCPDCGSLDVEVEAGVYEDDDL